MLALVLVLSACLDGVGGGSGLTGNADALAGLNLPARNGRPGCQATGGPQPTQVVYFNDSGSDTAVKSGVQRVGAGDTVNLQGVAVEVAAKSVLADVLAVPYTLDPSATGTSPRPPAAPRRDLNCCCCLKTRCNPMG